MIYSQLFRLSLLLFLLLVKTATAQSHNTPERRSVFIDGFDFSLAAGLELQKVTDERLVKWPVVADWDRSGRLVVVESGGVAWPIEEHNQRLLHRIVRLVDSNNDGVFDQRVLAADKLPFTEGVLCIDNYLLVAAPPHILKLTDNDGDGYCEERVVWFDGQTITGCANDLHGPYLARDGWVYWCKGAFAEQRHELLDGKRMLDRAAHIFRRKLGGGAIESVIAGGMDNPVELAMTSQGDRFFTSTFLQHPRNGRRDGVAYAVYGGVFGKQHDVLDDLPRTGPLMPIMTHLGPAAPSGLCCLESGWLSQEATDRQLSSTLVVAQFNLHRVSAHRLQPAGAGFRTDDQVLLSSERIDFHPTDVLPESHNSLLVLDTGGWYDLCCPTSSVDQKVAKGGIYRLSLGKDSQSSNAIQRAQPQFESDVDYAIASLTSQSPWIRRSALLKLRELGDQGCDALGQALSGSQAPPKVRLAWLWALSHIGSERALDVVAANLARASNEAFSHPTFLMAACNIVGLHRHPAASSQLRRLVSHENPALVRAAIEALGRLHEPNAIDALMETAERASADPTLSHSLIFALIEIGDRESLRRYLKAESASQKYAAMSALDQVGDDTIRPYVLTAVQSSHAVLRRKALSILARRPTWSQQSMAWLKQLLNQQTGWEDDEDLQRLLIAWREQDELVAMVCERIGNPELVARQKSKLLSIWRDAPLPAEFDELAQALVSSGNVGLLECLSLTKLTSEKHPRVIARIQELLQDEASSENPDLSQVRRLLQALPDDVGFASDKLAGIFIQRGEIALLSGLKISPSVASRLLAKLDQLDAIKLPDAARCIHHSKLAKLDREMLQRLRELPAAKALEPDFLTNLYRDRSDSLRRLAAELEVRLHTPPENIAAQVDDRLEHLPPGNAIRGMQIFRGPKANCSGCHKVGYVGHEIGPELTRIGKTRSRRALLEAILFPSARIEQGFRSQKILTVDGRVLSGLASRQGTTLRLQVSANKLISLSAAEVAQQMPSDVSIMPSGLHEQLSDQELADLVAFLEASR